MDNLKNVLSKPGWRRDVMPLEANRRQRIHEKKDDIIDLLKWYNNRTITLESMIRSLKSLNFIPGHETVLLLQIRPVATNDFLRSLEKSYNPGLKPVIHTSTNFIEAMMAPIPSNRPGIHRKYTKSQIPLTQDGEPEPSRQISLSRRPSDHGNIIAWQPETLQSCRSISRRYVNRSVIINNGTLQPRLARQLSERRHFEDPKKELHPPIVIDLINQNSLPEPEHSQWSNEKPPVVVDKSVYRIELDPNYKGTRAPYGTNQDEVDWLSNTSSSYDLRPPFDTDITSVLKDGLRPSPVMAWQ